MIMFNWTEHVRPLFMEDEEVERVDNFTDLNRCISGNCSIAGDISAAVSKAQTALSNLRHLWCRINDMIQLFIQVSFTDMNHKHCTLRIYVVSEYLSTDIFSPYSSSRGNNG